MMYHDNKLIVSLAGGLGNQLFQLAAGLGLSNGNPVEFDADVAYPRCNNLGQPEIQSFSMPRGVQIRSKRDTTWLMNKTTNLFLRMSASSIKFELFPGYRVLNLCASVVTSLYFKDVRMLKASTKLGDDEIGFDSKKVFLVGLFQTTRWASIPDVKQKLKSLEVSSQSNELKKLQHASISEAPLIVHVRLGDYLAEADFGIPSTGYYEEAITMALASGKYKSIWLFSNDLPGAQAHLPSNFDLPIRKVGDIGNSSAESLEAMRLGKGYVIANSTFSWWGAFLSHSQDPTVYYPEPWFKSTHSPNNLIPNNWIPINAWPESHT